MQQVDVEVERAEDKITFRLNVAWHCSICIVSDLAQNTATVYEYDLDVGDSGLFGVDEHETQLDYALTTLPEVQAYLKNRYELIESE